MIFLMTPMMLLKWFLFFYYLFISREYRNRLDCLLFILLKSSFTYYTYFGFIRNFEMENEAKFLIIIFFFLLLDFFSRDFSSPRRRRQTGNRLSLMFDGQSRTILCHPIYIPDASKINVDLSV